MKPADAAKMRELRTKHDVGPVAVHASYLINLCSQTESVRTNGVAAFRGEVERAEIIERAAKPLLDKIEPPIW